MISTSEKVLYQQHYVSPIDVLVGIGYLQPIHVQDWRKGKIHYLEKSIQANLKKISFAMKCFRKWANEKGLIPRKTAYLARTSGPKRELRFSKSGIQSIETAYRTHYISPLLTEKKQQRLKEKWEKSPELVAFITVNNSECSKCEKDMPKGSFLLMEADQPLCMSCAGLDELVFLPSGDAQLTRQAKKLSTKHVVVIKFSRTRKRYERQGLLVEEEALEVAESNLAENRED